MCVDMDCHDLQANIVYTEMNRPFVKSGCFFVGFFLHKEEEGLVWRGGFYDVHSFVFGFDYASDDYGYVVVAFFFKSLSYF